MKSSPPPSLDFDPGWATAFADFQVPKLLDDRPSILTVPSPLYYTSSSTSSSTGDCVSVQTAATPDSSTFTPSASNSGPSEPPSPSQGKPLDLVADGGGSYASISHGIAPRLPSYTFPSSRIDPIVERQSETDSNASFGEDEWVWPTPEESAIRKVVTKQSSATRLRPVSQPFVPRHQPSPSLPSYPLPIASPAVPVPAAAYGYGFENDSGAVAFVDAARLQELQAQITQAEQDRHAMYAAMSAAVSSSRRNSLGNVRRARPLSPTQPMVSHDFPVAYPLVSPHPVEEQSPAVVDAESRLAEALNQVLSLRARERTTSAPSTTTVPMTTREGYARRAGLYKTELCRSWEEKGSCRYGSRCQFAHGREDLRSMPRHHRFKSDLCKMFWMNGCCPYGKRCCYLHTTGSDGTAADIALGPDGSVLLPSTSSPHSKHASLPPSPTATFGSSVSSYLGASPADNSGETYGLRVETGPRFDSRDQVPPQDAPAPVSRLQRLSSYPSSSSLSSFSSASSSSFSGSPSPYSTAPPSPARTRKSSLLAGPPSPVVSLRSYR